MPCGWKGGARRRRWWIVLALFAGTWAALDLAAGRWLVRDGRLLGRQLPPFATALSCEQARAVQDRLEALAAGQPSESSFDAGLGWTNRPAQPAGSAVEGFNSIGGRGRREYAAVPPAGVLRIVSFGDSFTHCAQVGWADSWQAQLEAADPTLEAINLGVNGYGTDQALLRFRALGPGLRPQVVCIGIMLDNLMRNVNRYRPALYSAGGFPYCKPRFLLAGDALELLPTGIASERELLLAIADGSIVERMRAHDAWADPDLPAGLWRSTSVRVAALLARRGARRYRDLWLQPEGEARRVTLAILASFHREALQAGAMAAPVLVWPAKADLDGLVRHGDSYWHGPLVEALERQDIPCLDLARPLAAAAVASGDLEALYSGQHLSRAGNGVVAKALSLWLRERGISESR